MSHQIPDMSPLAEARAHAAALEAEKAVLLYRIGVLEAERDRLAAEVGWQTGAARATSPCVICGRPVEAGAARCRDGCTPRLSHPITSL